MSKKTSMLERLTKRYTKSTQQPNKPKPDATDESTSENHLDLDLDKVDNTKPKLNKFSHKFDKKKIQENVLGADFVQGLNLVDEDGNLDAKALNTAFQKVAFFAVQSAGDLSLDALSGFEEHNQGTLETFIRSNNDARSMTDKVFSDKASLQESALMKRAQLRTQFPDASPEEINEATEEWVQSNLEDLGLDEQSQEANKGSKDFQDVTEQVDTDWEKEFGLPPIKDVASKEEEDLDGED